MLSIDKKGTIKLTRGDTAYILVNIPEREYVEGDMLQFSVKTDYEAESYSVHKVWPANMVMVINPEDTHNLPIGRYVYDVQLDTEVGEVFTIAGQPVSI